jgi:16S rRNA (guanine1207-N2)-methyltransferase
MTSSRLSTALLDGLVTLPEGEIVVLRPPALADLAALPRERVRVLHGYRPDRDAWEQAGYAMTDQVGPVAVAVVCVPRSKALARGMIATAAAQARLVIVDGQKTDGIDSLFRDVRARLGDVPSLTKAHGRLFWFAGTEAFADWAIGAPSPGPEGFVTTAGVFSEGAVDTGSALLAAALPARLPARLADPGAGWGYLSAAALRREGVQSIDLIEAEQLALDCARINITDPPFHVGRGAEASLGRAFIQAAARMLTPGGQLWMVANRHLPYEATLNERFKVVTELGSGAGFKLYHAMRPRR